MSRLNLALATKVMAVANGGSQLAEIENFEMQIIRDGQKFVIGKNEDDSPKTKFFQKNLHFKKMSNFTNQVNSLTRGYDSCEIIAGEYKVKFKGGKFAINADRLLKEITENYFRTTHGIAIVDNESLEFEDTKDKFVDVFVGEQTSILNYLALIDTFKNANDSDLFNLSNHMTFSEDGTALQFSELVTNAIEAASQKTEKNILEIIYEAENPNEAYLKAHENRHTLSEADQKLLLKADMKLIEIAKKDLNNAE